MPSNLQQLNKYLQTRPEYVPPAPRSYNDRLTSVPQIFHETDFSGDHPATRRIKDKSPIFRGTSLRGPLPNVQLEAPADRTSVETPLSNHTEIPTAESEPVADKAKVVESNTDSGVKRS